MKRLVLLAFVLLAVSSVASAQVIPGSIGVFTDQLGTDCNIIDDVMGLKPVYVVHVGTNGSSASQWRLEMTPGVTMTYTGETSPYPTVIGNAFAGISIGYGGCSSGTFMILTVNFFGMGTTPACELFSIVADLATTSDMVEIVDCGFIKHLLTKGGQARINPNVNCMCNVATQESNWGKIKSLYR